MDIGLGMVDAKASAVDVSVGGHDFTLSQSPGILNSSRAGGTTGGAIWQASVRMAEWIVSSTSPLISYAPVSSLLQTSTVVELGCGISPLLALSLKDKVDHYIATDQEYILKLFKRNLDDNLSNSTTQPSTRKSTKASARSRCDTNVTKFSVVPLDWEKHDVIKQIRQYEYPGPISSKTTCFSNMNLVLACDCVFNESLVDPFVNACADICRINGQTMCVVGQQLRSPDVLELWMSRMLQKFKLFSPKTAYLSEGMQASSGFVVHLAIPIS